ncbi:MAG: T9SS type A sorting domain-containing protein [Chitinophagales bacterium]|nr:T9SS type A sorting domain-containing protein [Chitinophagales bacterium]
MFNPQVSLAQTNSPFTATKPEHLGVDRAFDSIYDGFGNKWAIEDLEINDSSASNTTSKQSFQLCTSGYFKLYFEQGCGMEGATPIEIARRNVICKLFLDISNFINSPLLTSGQHINIWVRDINAVLSTPCSSSGQPTLGLATSFYSIPNNLSAGGIADNLIWQTINTGVDAYNNFALPLTAQGIASNGYFNYNLYHGVIAFNFNASCGINWCPSNSWATLPLANSSEFDLYTVALHEITHSLGFSSAISSNGTSIFSSGGTGQYFTRYDSYLETSNGLGRPSGTHLITSPSSSCTNYNVVFNANVSASVLAPAGASSKTNIEYVSSSNFGQPVYTPAVWAPNLSLSHFDDMSFNNGAVGGSLGATSYTPCTTLGCYFTMTPNYGLGVNNRYLMAEEKNVLCDLGYSLNNSFGSSTVIGSTETYTNTCNNSVLAGLNDGIIGGGYTYTGVLTTSGGSFLITNILSNDYDAHTSNLHPTSFKCLEDITDPTITLSTTSGSFPGNFTFNYTGSSKLGVHILRYIPYDNATYNSGNITYIFVYLSNKDCTPSMCNLVSNGDFESNIGPINPAQFLFPLDNKEACWQDVLNNYDVYSDLTTPGSTFIPSSANYVPTSRFSSPALNYSMTTTPNHNFIGIVGWYNKTKGYYLEAIENVLQTPLIAGQSYVLSLQANLADSKGNVLSPYPFGHLRVLGTNSLLPSNSFPISLLSTNPSSAGYYDLVQNIPTANWFEVPLNGNAWNNFTCTFTAPVNLSYIVIVNDAVKTYSVYGSVPSNKASYIYIDNVEIQPASTAVTLNLPKSACSSNDIINNLSQYLSNIMPGGVFTINIQGNAGLSYSAGQCDYNPALAGAGLHIITYTYTDVNGCKHSVSDNIGMQQSWSLAVTSTPTTVCYGSPLTFYASTINLPVGTTVNYMLYDPNNVLIQNTTSNVLTVANTTQFGAYTIVASALGCTNTSTIGIQQELNPFTFTCQEEANCSNIVHLSYIGNGGTNPTQVYSINIAFQPNGGSPIPLSNFTSPSLISAPIAIPLTGAPILTGGTIIITITSAKGCTFTQVINLEPCCDYGIWEDSHTSNFSLLFKNTTTSALIANLGGNTIFASYNSNPSSKIIVIDGILTVDASFTFQNWDNIKLTKNAKIELSGPNVKLTFDGCHLSACDNYMWKGIFASNSTQEIVFTNSLIEDAECAIKSLNGQIYAQNTVFNKNLISLNIINMGQHNIVYNGTAVNTICKNCKFYCHSNIAFTSNGGSSWIASYSNPPSALATLLPSISFPTGSYRSMYGIVLNNVGSGSTNFINVIGNRTNNYANSNHFDNIDQGIYCKSISNVKITDNYFSNIGTTPTIYAVNTILQAGVALYVNQVNLAYAAYNKFNDCSLGIDWFNSGGISNTSPCVEYNIFNQSSLPAPFITATGLKVRGEIYKRFNCFQNSFTNLNYSITTIQNSACKITIDQNHIYSQIGNTLQQTRGISINEISTVLNNRYSVTNNDIHNCNTGISVVNNRAASINVPLGGIFQRFLGNTIYFNKSTGIGISLNGSQNQTVQCNSVINTGNIFYAYHGLKISGSSPYNLIDGNNFQNTAIGAYVLGNQTPTYFTGNYFFHDIRGIELDQKGYIGDQGKFLNPSYGINTQHWGNKWALPNLPNVYATYTDNGSNKTTTTPAMMQNHIFVLASDKGGATSTYGFNTLFSQSNASAGILDFANLGSIAPYYTSIACQCSGCRSIEEGDAPITEGDEALASINLDSLTNSFSDEELTSTFFHQLALYEQLQQNPDMRSFIIAQSSTTPEAEIISDFLDRVDLLGNEESNNIKLIYQLETELDAAFDSTITDSSAFFANRQAQILNAISLNDQINSELMSVTYLKMVNTIYLPMLLSDSLPIIENNDLLLLQMIANSCPSQYGPAVENARTLLRAYGIQTEYDDEEICSVGLRTSNNLNDNSLQNDIDAANASLKDNLFSNEVLQNLNIYPNPSDVVLNFEYEQVPVGSVLEIVNAVGVNMLSLKLNTTSGKQEVIVDQFPAGVYIAKIIAEGKVVKLVKFNIIHH